MHFNKIIALTIVPSFFVCGHNISASVDNFKLKKFIGVWFDIGRILKGYEQQHVLKCNRFNVTVQNDRDQTFNEVYEFEMNGNTKQVTAHGRIYNSNVHIIFPAVDNDESIYKIIEYENGEELIFCDINDPKSYGIVSRRPTVSPRTKEEFDRIAARVRIIASYLDHNNCSYDYQIYF